jgi:hypothetical protein
MSLEYSEKRADIRYEFPSTLEYGLISDKAGEVLKGLTINISSSGLCLYVYDSLCQGQEIAIKKCVLPFPCKRAVVRWIKKVDEDVYMSGMKFLT